MFTLKTGILLSGAALLGCCGTALGYQVQASQAQLQSLFAQAGAAMQSGHPELAEKYLKQATVVAPDLPQAFLDLGMTQLKEGKLAEAKASIEKSLQIDPTLAGAHLFMGIANYQTNHIPEAIHDLELEATANPDNAEAEMWLGIVELKSGHPEKATGPLDRAAELAPKDVNVLDYRGQAHMQVAKDSYAQMYHLDPGSWRVHRLNAQIAAQAEQHKNAIDEYLAAIKIAPGEADLYEGLGEEYRKTGAVDLAENAFAEQLKLTPGNPVAMYDLGSVRVDRGEEEKGVPLLEQVVKLYGAPTVADYYLARGLASEGKNAEAIAEFKRACEVQGEVQKRAWYELAQIYRKAGQTAEAHQALLKYQQLRQEADKENAKQVADWRKLNEANSHAGVAPE